MIKSAFLSPKEAESCSWNKPSPNTFFGYSVKEGKMEISRKMQAPMKIKLYLLGNEFFLQSLILE